MGLHLTRTKILVVSTIAFVGGVLFASSMDWTDRVFAQGGTAAAPAPKPTVQDVKSIADASNAFVSIAEHVTPSVVSIQAERQARARGNRNRQLPPGFEEFFRQYEPQQPQLQQSSGSGFIVSRDGYILTNNHVVEDAARVRVAMQDRRVFDARVVGRDPTTDVAVLKIDARNLPTTSFGDDEKLRIGEWVMAIGNPLGLDFTVTVGIVSAKGRALAGLNPTEYAISDFIQTDAAINPGNSGGPLVNARGEVIGINSAIASQTGLFSGYGFAIPITLAQQVMDDLIKHGEVRRAVLGVAINEVSPEDAQVAGLNRIAGVKVEGYTGQDSPGMKAGLEPGDVITKADGKAVDRVSALQRVIRARKPGETVELEAMRYGTRKSFRVRLGAAPTDSRTVAAAEPAPATPPPASSRLGVSVEPVTAELVRASAMPDQFRGLRVAVVEPGSPADERGLAVGDVLVQVLPSKDRIRSPDDLQTALNGVKKGEVISFLVYRPAPDGAGQTRVVNLRTN